MSQIFLFLLVLSMSQVIGVVLDQRAEPHFDRARLAKLGVSVEDGNSAEMKAAIKMLSYFQLFDTQQPACCSCGTVLSNMSVLSNHLSLAWLGCKRNLQCTPKMNQEAIEHMYAQYFVAKEQHDFAQKQVEEYQEIVAACALKLTHHLDRLHAAAPKKVGIAQCVAARSISTEPSPDEPNSLTWSTISSELKLRIEFMKV